MMQKKWFHIGDVLSVITGYMVSPRNTKGLVDILSFMLSYDGEPLRIYHIPRADGLCKSPLRNQFPQLVNVDASNVNKGNLEQWLAEQVAKYGEMLEVTQLIGVPFIPADMDAEVALMQQEA